jgi:hypothetical protein
MMRRTLMSLTIAGAMLGTVLAGNAVAKPHRAAQPAAKRAN